MARLLALITTTTAWHTQQQLRRPTRLYRIKNSASVGAEAPVAPKIRYTKPDLTSATDTFAALARMCGVTTDVQDATLDFQGFALAFEQLFNRNVPLTPEALDELKAAVDEWRFQMALPQLDEARGQHDERHLDGGHVALSSTGASWSTSRAGGRFRWPSTSRPSINLLNP